MYEHIVSVGLDILIIWFVVTIMVLNIPRIYLVLFPMRSDYGDHGLLGDPWVSKMWALV